MCWEMCIRDRLKREANIESPFSALAFKIMTDPFVGRLTYMRVYSGKLDKGSYIYNSNIGKRERVSRILQMHANKREERDEVAAGEIVAVVGLKTQILVTQFAMKNMVFY